MDKRTNVITKNPINFIGTRFLKLYLLIGFILRIILMWNVPEDSSFSFWEIIRFLGISDKKRPKISCNPFIYYSFEQKTFR